MFDVTYLNTVDKDNRGLTVTPQRSSRYPAEKLADLDYADDIALFEASEAAMAETTEAIRNIAGKLCLQMSYKKTRDLTNRKCYHIKSCRSTRRRK